MKSAKIFISLLDVGINFIEFTGGKNEEKVIRYF